MKLNKLTIAITLIAGSSIFAAVAFNGSQMEPVKKAPESALSSHVQPEPSNVSPESGDLPSSQSQIHTKEQGSKTEQASEKEALSKLPQVSIINVTSGEYQAEVVGHGEVKSRYELMFSAEVSGRVESVSTLFETGQVVNKGDVIARIDDTSYLQAVSLAKSNVAQAKLNLLEEQRQGEQAKSEWEHSGLSGEPDSPLVLRKPQLAQVTAALENAQLELKKARQDLEKTQVKAPFDALVVTRDIQPGSYVQPGTQVATLYSIDEVEVTVPLSESQWKNLPSLDNQQLQSTSWPVTLESSDGAHQWQGNVERVEQHLSQDTRQRSLIVVVANPLEQVEDLYPGMFVKTVISGKALDQLWQLPASALSQQGDVWVVDSQGLLAKSSAQAQFEINGLIYIDPNSLDFDLNTSTKAVVHVVKRPLSSFQVGMKVMAKVEG